MRRHPDVGASIVENIKGKEVESIVGIVRHHHEDFDGTGYPTGLAGENIPFLARVLRVADSYDAMTSRRPYRRRMAKKKVLSEIKGGRGTQFDPAAAEAMLKLIRAGSLSPLIGENTTVVL